MIKNKLYYLFLLFSLFVTCSIRETFPDDAAPVLVIDSDGEKIHFCKYRVMLDPNTDTCKAIPEQRESCKTIDSLAEIPSKKNRADVLKKNLYKGLTNYILESRKQKVNRKILFSARGILNQETTVANELEAFLIEKEFAHTKSILTDDIEAELTFQSIRQKFASSQGLAVLFAQKESTRHFFTNCFF